MTDVSPNTMAISASRTKPSRRDRSVRSETSTVRATRPRWRATTCARAPSSSADRGSIDAHRLARCGRSASRSRDHPAIDPWIRRGAACRLVPMSRRIAVAASIWGTSILASRLIGLVREAVLGRTLGAGSEADAYWAAFVVPDFLNYLLAGGALSIVFIPLFAAHCARGDERGAWESFSAVANALGAGLLVLAAAAWFALPALAPVVAPGFDATGRARLVELARIVLFAQPFHVIGGLLAAALQARDRHLLPALSPLVYNLSIVAGGLLGGRAYGAKGFAWGVLAGSALGPFLLPLLGCRAIGLRWRPRIQL